MEQLNSETVAIATDKLASTNIQVSSHVQRNGRRKLEDRFVVENDLNSAFELDVSATCFVVLFAGRFVYFWASHCTVSAPVYLMFVCAISLLMRVFHLTALSIQNLDPIVWIWFECHSSIGASNRNS